MSDTPSAARSVESGVLDVPVALRGIIGDSTPLRAALSWYQGSFTDENWYQVQAIRFPHLAIDDPLPASLDEAVQRMSDRGKAPRVTPLRHYERHSHDGFAWGYGGSGPSDLALALLADATQNVKLATVFYQDYKWAVVARLGTLEDPNSAFLLSGAGVLAWVYDQSTDVVIESYRAVRRLTLKRLGITPR